jgi:hypothetical protein
MFRTNVCPKHVELLLKVNKYCYLLHLVGLDFITLPILKMNVQTQIKKYLVYTQHSNMFRFCKQVVIRIIYKNI